MIKPFIFLFTILLININQSASAQPQAKSKEGWSYTVGAGTIVAPSYLGDDEYQLLAIPNIGIKYEDKFFATVNEGIGYNVINNDNWRIGPIVKADFGRDEDGEAPFSVSGDDTNDLRGLGDVDGTAEVGGFIEYKFMPFTTKLELRQAVSGHEGFVGEADVNYRGRATVLERPIFYSFGPTLRFGSSDYHEAYFGVDAEQSRRSGLAQYDAEEGITSYGLSSSVVVPLTENVSTVFFANYSQLGEEPADSSLVDRRGAEEQGMVGFFVNYSFSSF